MAPAMYQTPPQAPPLFTGTKTSIVADTKRLIDKSRAMQDNLAKTVKPDDATFEKVLGAFKEDEEAMALESHILGFYQAVSADSEVRDASTEADKMLDEFSIESSTREDMFKLVDAVFKQKPTLDAEDQRMLEKERKNFVQNGLSLPPGPQRDRYKEIKLRLSQLAIQFQKTLNEENGALWFTPEELQGVPDDLVSTFQKGEGENEGKLRVTFKYPDLFPVTKHAKSVDTRRKMYIGNENRCNENVPLFAETIVLRDEAARLLGYPNHAAFRIEDKMAKKPKTVDDFLGDLRERLRPLAQRELDVLAAMKRKDAGTAIADTGDELYAWEFRYYDARLLERDYKVDNEKISEYFPLQVTLSKMLEIFETLLGLKFVELTEEDRNKLSPTGKGGDITWHEDVQVFSVWNDESEGNDFVGYLYTDLHPRQGKYGHAANFNIQPGFLMKNGTRRHPATALVCNFSKPSAKRPSLLKHDEVVTLFHELGHGIHDLVSKTKYARFHGTSVVQDFVEAPSQMLENWCWTPSQLKFLSHHYSDLSAAYAQTWKESNNGETTLPQTTIPDDILSALIKTKHVNDAIGNLRQLHFGTFDMTVHEPESHDAVAKMNFTHIYNTLRPKITMIPGPESINMGLDWGHGQATFGHLMGGYDAGYYGYLSSQVYSMDMFYSVFAKDPMNKEEGRRYRHAVLEKGGSQEEMETLKGFLGREPKSDAFYKELGLGS